MDDYGFALSGVTLPGGTDPTGLWEVQVASAISFAAADASPSSPTWHVRLPASSEEATALLEAQARVQTLAWQDLTRVESDLVGLGRPEATSFSPTDPLLVEKAALLTAVDRLQPSPVSYAIPLGTTFEEQEIVRQWNAFVAEVQRIVTHYAYIRTTIVGVDVGLTAVSWTGDFKTHWVPGSQSDVAALHIRAVQMALDSRLALLSVASVVAAGAVGLAVKAAVPGGQLLLLPAVWRFVRDVLQTLRQSWPQLQNL
ncbi:MAG: hypothetical protein JXR84_12480 [Anaerolineae bacterium]|nr:hypothetical protein [Anaerolineae bacterium]